MNEAELNDLFVSVIVVFVMGSLSMLAIRALPREERLLPQLSFVMHIALAAVLFAMTKYVFKVADVFHYFETGSNIARLMRLDFNHWGVEALKLLFRRPNDIEMTFADQFGAGRSATSSMIASVGFLMLLLNDAQYASFIFMGGLAFLGKLAAYRGMRALLPTMGPTRIAAAMLFIPSVVFWSAGVIKESWATTGLGLLNLWLARVSTGSLMSSPHLLVLGALPVLLFKPYLLFPFTLAAGAWYVSTRQSQAHTTVAPFYSVLAPLVTFGGILALGAMFQEFSVEELGASAADHQVAGAYVTGGSSYTLGNAQARTLTEQIRFAPLALVTVLMRPFPFEIHNFTSSLASLEVTVLVVLFARLVRRNSFKSVYLTIKASPTLIYCFVFTLVSGVAIGLATSNFGTLVRYRSPMMTYYVLLIVVLVDERNGVRPAASRLAAERDRRELPPAVLTRP